MTDNSNGGRINRQVQATGNNFWNTGHTRMSTFGIQENPSIEQKIQVAPFTRLNQTRFTMKQMNGHVSDGTALNLGDPSSMRDQGGVRNCVYTGAVSFNESKSMERLPYKQFLRRDGP